jgi:hypothetical protein
LITLELALLLRLSSCCIEDWDFSKKEHLLSCSYIISIYFFARLYPKTQKHHLLLLFTVKLANQYLQLLMGLTTFSILKGTTIEFLHLGVIKILFWCCCQGA